ncbi:hypothetical protein P8625_06485 [Tenacibaculum tangerinum]|uniref:Uncharacterized protein n=1 Tax=Tenacibaculum tangerinum TaxID=3038772 RepID=A0ABY8L9U2_9FLAO|nr:hypothetical protein [Tenacibaculum tangerinum]WGH76790.1 hypothetical protein P8625_06485 [Tenacibaculum tangerinum]
MDKFKFGLFDIFVYTLPGFIVLVSLYFLCLDIDLTIVGIIQKSMNTLDKLSFNSFLLVFVCSYILGLVLDYFGYNYFNLVGKRIWKKALKGKEKSLSKMENKYVLVRHFSKENFIYLELWNASRGMSFNLSLAFIILGLSILIKIIEFSYFNSDWIIAIIGCIIFSFVMLRRAVTYHKWSHNTLEKTVDKLKLK